MDFQSQWHRGTFPASMDALKAARKVPFTQDTVDSIRRIAHNLRQVAGSYGFHGLAEAAHHLEVSDGAHLTGNLDTLIAELGQIPMDPSEAMPGILIVESDLQMSKLLETILGGTDREIFIAKSVLEAHQLVEAKTIELVVLDLSLQGSDGRDLLMDLRGRAATASLPVIVLSGLSGPLPKAECYALGADAFFEKPVAPEVLKAAISARLHRSLEHQREARQDPLTGLPNRAAFAESFSRLASMAERRREPLSLALLDFDHLHKINEKYGHATGDGVLRHASESLEKALRKSDLLSRWGGDEFALLLSSTGLEGARQAVGKALRALRHDVFRSQDGHAIPYSFSAGVVPVLPRADIEGTMAEADRYLFVAKTSGRRRLVTERDKDRLALPVHKILLLESDPLLSQRVEESFRREGFEVIVCENGFSALQTVAGMPLSLCVLDLDPASREGQAILHEIHKRGATRARVLLLTELGSNGKVEFGFQTGVDDELPKPFTAFDLMSRVHQLLRK